MRGRQSRDVARDPEPQTLDLDQLALVHDILINAGGAGLSEKGAQGGMPRRGGSKSRRGARGRARHADHVIAPGLASDPVQGILPVSGVIGVDPVLPFGAVAPTGILINRGIAMRDDIAPATQNRATQRFLRVRQPCPRDVGLIGGIGCRNAVGRPMQDDRPARTAGPRQEDKGVQAGAVTHRNHDLEATRLRPIVNGLHGDSTA